ncbi:competence type IV pilus major pilin ComGC [Halalkalibacter sp. AB-rgal2]|uniref:competence type IV pilus major pilin ComGC n=1 Tax=Halalkalibacter sp. AB-rgal2 TaxID=3242695 RepID=UPI00359EA826
MIYLKRLNQRGFTLVEMLVVLMIISLLLVLVVPNLTKNSDIAQETSCEATVKLVQAQVYAYFVETGEKLNSLAPLVGDYIETDECPNGSKLMIDSNSQKVSVE